MERVIERGLFAQQPLKRKLSPEQRALPSHVVNLACIKPTSEKRRRQLVLAQRRCREKSRHMKRLNAAMGLVQAEVDALKASRKAAVTAHHASSISRKFVQYLEMYAHGMAPPASSARRAQLAVEQDLFAPDVVVVDETDDQRGHTAIETHWRRWTAAFSAFHMTVLATDVLAMGRGNPKTLDTMLRVSVETKLTVGNVTLTQRCPDHSECLGMTVVVKGWFVAHFDAVSGRVSRLQSELPAADALNVMTQTVSTPQLTITPSHEISSKRVKKDTIQYILN
ncbi:Aste57867_17583 [Aphanomyces stellatus]|uniref:Aste57867_17583 protein n=1 Tax=Aphanomyces stellatus TaxID=120398 RepID=A0A485L9C8_9STRA|nr:hypothetical protein As57867_017523 [Aphanomyces stellatus]VFT94334.1 Aste57867_17583 [Aphanomyces stellatus]